MTTRAQEECAASITDALERVTSIAPGAFDWRDSQKKCLLALTEAKIAFVLYGSLRGPNERPSDIDLYIADPRLALTVIIALLQNEYKQDEFTVTIGRALFPLTTRIQINRAPYFDLTYMPATLLERLTAQYTAKDENGFAILTPFAALANMVKVCIWPGVMIGGLNKTFLNTEKFSKALGKIRTLLAALPPLALKAPSKTQEYDCSGFARPEAIWTGAMAAGVWFALYEIVDPPIAWSRKNPYIIRAPPRPLLSLCTNQPNESWMRYADLLPNPRIYHEEPPRLEYQNLWPSINAYHVIETEKGPMRFASLAFLAAELFTLSIEARTDWSETSELCLAVLSLFARAPVQMPAIRWDDLVDGTQPAFIMVVPPTVRLSTGAQSTFDEWDYPIPVNTFYEKFWTIV